MTTDYAQSARHPCAAFAHVGFTGYVIEMNPSAFTRYDTLRAEYRAVRFFLLQGVKRAENLFLRVNTGGFLPPTREHFVRVVVSVVVVVTIAIRIVAFVFVVVFMSTVRMLMIVVVTITVWIVAFVFVVVFVPTVRMLMLVVVTITVWIVTFVFVVVFVAPMSVFTVRMRVIVVVFHCLYELVHFRL